MNKVPKRFYNGMLIFFLCLVNYTNHFNLNLKLLAMVESTEPNSTVKLPDYGPRYKWSKEDQSRILNAYFYGYILTAIPGGMLSEYCGSREVGGWTTLATGWCTLLTPIIIWAGGKWAFYMCRFSIGLFNGMIFPCCQCLISRWAPPDEKGKFVAATLGGTFSIVLTWPFCDLIVEKVGWKIAFYLGGILAFIGSGLWFYNVAACPKADLKIKPEERAYIEASLVGLGQKTTIPPFPDIISSAPFWALTVLQFGNVWGLYVQIRAVPQFLYDVFQLDVKLAGSLSSLPFLMRFICGFIFGSIGDFLRRKNMCSVTKMRKFFCFTSHIIPGLFLVLLTYCGKELQTFVMLTMLCFAFNGSAVVSNLINVQDLSPNYAGTLYGIINTIGSTSILISATIAESFTNEESTFRTWSDVFLIAAAVYIVSALVFFIFGSGEIQPWNELSPQNEDDLEMEIRNR